MSNEIQLTGMKKCKNQSIEEFEALVAQIENNIKSGKYVNHRDGNPSPALRYAVWCTFASEKYLKAKCYCCKTRTIEVVDFKCCHVISRQHGGPTVLENLRPICALCNKSMKAMNMCTFIRQEGFWNYTFSSTSLDSSAVTIEFCYPELAMADQLDESCPAPESVQNEQLDILPYDEGGKFRFEPTYNFLIYQTLPEIFTVIGRVSALTFEEETIAQSMGFTTSIVLSEQSEQLQLSDQLKLQQSEQSYQPEQISVSIYDEAYGLFHEPIHDLIVYQDQPEIVVVIGRLSQVDNEIFQLTPQEQEIVQSMGFMLDPMYSTVSEIASEYDQIQIATMESLQEDKPESLPRAGRIKPLPEIPVPKAPIANQSINEDAQNTLMDIDVLLDEANRSQSIMIQVPKVPVVYHAIEANTISSIDEDIQNILLKGIKENRSEESNQKLTRNKPKFFIGDIEINFSTKEDLLHDYYYSNEKCRVINILWGFSINNLYQICDIFGLNPSLDSSKSKLIDDILAADISLMDIDALIAEANGHKFIRICHQKKSTSFNGEKCGCIYDEHTGYRDVKCKNYGDHSFFLDKLPETSEWTLDKINNIYWSDNRYLCRICQNVHILHGCINNFVLNNIISAEESIETIIPEIRPTICSPIVHIPVNVVTRPISEGVKKRRTKGELACANFLDSRKINYTSEVSISNLPRRRFDFEFNYNGRNFLLEFDGKQHFEFIPFFHDQDYNIFLEKQRIDVLKTQRGIKAGYCVIRIDYTQIDDIDECLEEALNTSDSLYVSNKLMYRYITDAL